MKKEFDFKKYVVDNQSTVSSKLSTKKPKKLLEENGRNALREAETDEFATDDFEKEPSKKDLKSTSNSLSGNSKKRTLLSKLTAQKNELLQKLKSGSITIDQYKQQIKTIPQQIKTLTADLSQMLRPDEDEPDLDEIGGPRPTQPYWTRHNAELTNIDLTQHFGETIIVSDDQSGGTGTLIAVGKKNGDDIVILEMEGELVEFDADYIKSLMDGVDDDFDHEYGRNALGEIHPTEKGRIHRMNRPGDGLVDRIEGIANAGALRGLKQALQTLVPDWLQDGFEEDDIAEYLKFLVAGNV